MLANRLQILEAYLPQLSFLPLAKLALGGDGFKDALTGILALNDVRNAYAHEFDEPSREPTLSTFCRAVGMFWPEADKLGRPKSFAAAKDAAVRSASCAALVEVWVRLAELLIQRGEFDSEDERLRWETGIAESKALVRELRREQNLIREHTSIKRGDGRPCISWLLRHRAVS